jgi:hypothetical protein
MTSMEPLTDTALIVGATMRLTRLVVTDDLGQWWIKDPLDRLYHPSIDYGPDEVHREVPPRLVKGHRYLGGLDCPYCCGFWIGAGVIASHAIAKRVGMLGAWRFVASAFTLNEVAAHANVWIGDV